MDRIMPRLVAIDDHPPILDCFRLLARELKKFELVGTFGDAASACLVIEELRPHVIFIDVGRDERNGGAEGTRRLLKKVPDAKVVAYTMHDSSLKLRAMMRAGAVGYVLKGEDTRGIIKAVDTVMRGGLYLSDKMKDSMLADYVWLVKNCLAIEDSELDDRERQILAQMLDGRRAKEIAEGLDVNHKTVYKFVETIMGKLGAKNRGELFKLASELDLN
ncbi:MAG: hypothetical protein C0404_14530 [Verrucomicrobia bacterium]|nr:hypothetical protein [Verrucomicrobiota bacterium]